MSDPMQPAPDNDSLQRAYTRCRFGQLHYRIAAPEGDLAGPPLVLLHQNPSSGLEYASFAREMAKDRQVVAFDTPGNGMSDRPPEPQTMADYASAFAEGLDALGLGQADKVDVFGFHTGTYLAVELALARPDLVGRVILAGVPMRPEHERAARLQEALNPPPLTPDGESLFTAMRQLWEMTVAGRDPSTPLDRAIAVFADRIRPMQRMHWPYVGVWSYDAQERLPRITQPVLILQPHEPLLEHTRAAAALIPDVRMIEFPHLARDVFEAGVKDFAAAIRQWPA